MFRRLCLLLLMLGLTLPAAAAPLHCLPVATTEAVSSHHGEAHGERQVPAEQAPQHECIGCVVTFPEAVPPAVLPPPPVARHKAQTAHDLARAASGPDTPPPRV